MQQLLCFKSANWAVSAFGNTRRGACHLHNDSLRSIISLFQPAKGTDNVQQTLPFPPLPNVGEVHSKMSQTVNVTYPRFNSD
jgi:hypothetical protein